MIDEKKLIEDVKQCFKNLLEGGIIDNETMWLAKEIRNIIDKQPKTDWIPCEERLPNKGDVVLAQYHGWNGFDKIVMAYIREDDEWKIEFGGVCNYSSIFAWQPLPQPYKKEGAENE